MTDNTVTIILDGDKVPLAEFARVLGHFNELIKALSSEIGESQIDWVIQDLQISSTVASIAGIGEEVAIEKAIAGYEKVGEALEANAEIPFSTRIRSEAWKIVSISDARISAVRFETARRESIVKTSQERRIEEIKTSGPQLVPGKPTIIRQASFGAIQGRIQTISNRGSLRFTLYDLLHDKAVSCYFAEGKQDIIRDLWGSIAIVEGFVTRDPNTGRPLSIRQISEVTPIQEAKSRTDYQEARGAAPSLSGLSPEEAIRRIRDAQ